MPPSFPESCQPEQLTASLPVSIHHRHASGFYNNKGALAPLAHIKQGTSIAAATVGQGYTSNGTRYTQTLGGLHGPERGAPVEADLRAYVGAWEWRKCGQSTSQSCSVDSVSSTVTTAELPLRTLDLNSTSEDLQIVAYLRTTTAYVDKPNFHIVFSALDKFGSPRFLVEGAVAFTVASIANDEELVNPVCAVGTFGDDGDGLYSCSGTINSTAFSNTTALDYTLQLTGSIADSIKHQAKLGRVASEHGLNNLTRAKHPDWWSTQLRADLSECAAETPYYDGCNAWPATVTRPEMSTVITTPTYPLYPGETFDVHLYHITTYINNAKIGAFDFTVRWNPAVVTCQSAGLAPNPYFEGVSATLDATSGQATITVTSAAATRYFNGFFLMYKIRFKVVASLSAGPKNSGIAVQMGQMFTAGNQEIGGATGHYSSVYDHRQEATHGGSCGGVECDLTNMGSYDAMKATNNTASINVAPMLDRATLLVPHPVYKNKQQHGIIYNYRAIDGHASRHDVRWQTHVINDYMPYAQRTEGMPSQSITHPESADAACNGNGTSHYVLESGAEGLCAIRPRLDAPGGSSEGVVGVVVSSRSCGGQYNASCASAANFVIKTPESITVTTTDPTDSLDRIVSASSSGYECDDADDNDTPYQSARVVVYADGADVTPLATGLHISAADGAYGKFVRSSGANTWNFYEGQDATLVRGTAVGTFVVKLYNDEDGALEAGDGSVIAPNVSVAVTDDAVYAVEKRAMVVTGLAWGADPQTTASGYDFAQTPEEDSFAASVVAEQVFRQRPVTGTMGHYGYLFNVITFNDTAEEEVPYGEMNVTTTSSNIRVTCAGAGCQDDHAGTDLTLYNEYTDRYMVSVSKSAITECVDGNFRVTWERCGVEVATSFPIVHVKMPDPIGIRFNITNDGDRPGGSALFLTPTNGAAAAFATAAVSTTSGFKLTVVFRDYTATPPLSEVDTYANAPDEDGVLNITYRSLDTSCATVDNDANELTVVQGATCDYVQIEVTITLADKFTFVATDVARVVRASHVVTVADAYPDGDIDIPTAVTTRRLPCFSGVAAAVAEYERYTLTTYGWLEHEAGPEYTISDLMHPDILSNYAFDVSSLMDWGASGGSGLGNALDANIDQVPSRVGVTGDINSNLGHSGYADFGANKYEFDDDTWHDFENITVHPFRLHINTDPMGSADWQFDSDTDTSWNELPNGLNLVVTDGDNTFNDEPNGKIDTTFTMEYSRVDAVTGGPASVTFKFANLMSNAYADWFDYTHNMLSFTTNNAAVINVSAAGQLTLLDNHQVPVLVQANLCYAETGVSSPATSAKPLWANLRPDGDRTNASGYELGDVDVGTSSGITTLNNNEQFSPFYMDDTVGIKLYVALKLPPSRPYCASAEIIITLPDVGFDTQGTTWNAALSGVTFSTTDNNDNDQNPYRQLKVGFAADGDNVGGTNENSQYLYLGYFELPPQADLAVAPADGAVVTVLGTIQTANGKTVTTEEDGLVTMNEQTTRAGTATAKFGENPSRRRLLDGSYGYLAPSAGVARHLAETMVQQQRDRRLQASCTINTADGCPSTLVYGDVNKDCQITTADKTTLINMIASRKDYVDGLSASDPLTTLEPCEFTRQQFNPMHNLIDGVPDDDPRASSPDISVADAVHLLQAIVADGSRFIQPHVTCVPSADALGEQPDLLVEADVYKYISTNKASERCTDITCRVYFEILVTGRDLSNSSRDVYVEGDAVGLLDFNVSTGTRIYHRDDASTGDTTYEDNDESTGIPYVDAHDWNGLYSGVPVNDATLDQNSLLVRAEYNASTGRFEARVQPHMFDFDVSYYVAISTESKKFDGSIQTA